MHFAKVSLEYTAFFYLMNKNGIHVDFKMYLKSLKQLDVGDEQI